MQAFLNTHYDLTADRGGELFLDPDAARDWLAKRGLVEKRAQMDTTGLGRAIALREGLRALAFANNGEHLDSGALDAMQKASRGVRTEIRIGAEGPRFVAPAARTIHSAIGILSAITARSMIEGTWPRLKACPGRNCGWVFFDHSRNQSARWCSMKVCGDRDKARAYYRRQTEERLRANPSLHRR